MSAIVVIGEELDCVAFGLAGVDSRQPAPHELADEFARTLAEASLVVLSRATAQALAPNILRDAMRRESPLVVVLPDIAAPQADEAFARRIRTVLGIES
ncbi:MAG: hypothetical protein OEY03_05100 [Rhizobacter sp.]|nr:hypothetical protein [Rhizobacter sp.]